jgi:glycosyltransferase involved in cell wall biosynthesis
MGLEGKAAIYNGWLDNYVKKAIICAADIVALPSLYEPFSSLTLEVLSADLACEANDLSVPVLVVGDTGGITEIIRNGYNGFKVPMEEDRFDLKPEYLTRVLEMVVADDKLQAKISKGAIETIQKKAFEWDNVLKLIFQTYSKSKDNHFELSKMQRDDVEPIPVYAEKTGLVENYVQV